MVRRKRPAQGTSDTPTTPQGGTAQTNPEESKTWAQEGSHKAERKWIESPDPRDTIDLGDGRRLEFYRNNQYQQVGVRFTAPEGVNPKPSAEETQWLKDQGYEKWRPETKSRTMQLLTPEQKNEIAAIEEINQDDAIYTKARMRAKADFDAQATVVELANIIRGRNGLRPVMDVFIGPER